MNEHERVVVDAFISSNIRDRYRFLLNNSKRRVEAMNRLNHCHDLDERFTTWPPSNAPVEELLRAAGSPMRVWVMSCADELDGLQLKLNLAIQRAQDLGWGTIVSCIPGKLAYYYDECGERRAILNRS